MATLIGIIQLLSAACKVYLIDMKSADISGIVRM